VVSVASSLTRPCALRAFGFNPERISQTGTLKISWARFLITTAGAVYPAFPRLGGEGAFGSG